jgi:hypothetical protein
MSILAPATTAPDASETVPVMAPVAPPCANMSPLKQAMNNPTATKLRMLNMFPP